MEKTSILEWAKKYKDKGFSVIPITLKEKFPAIESWKEYQNRHATNDELEKWFGNGSRNNIGIVTGGISGIAVLDFDSKEAIQYSKDLKFPETPSVKTNKGFHYYYEYKEGVRNFQKRDDLPGIDLRGDGGYVVAPPSIHPSGYQYEWVEGKGLDDIPYEKLPDVIPGRSPNHKKLLKELYTGTQEGNRNNHLARLVGSWVNDDLTFNECVENARIWNSKNNPPLPEKEIVGVINSILQKHEQENMKVNIEAWQEPIPFDNYFSLPEFPTEILPSPGREMVVELAKINQVDVGLPASIYLGVLSACLSKKAIVNLNTHEEPVNIYICSILDSGGRKTSTMRLMMYPIYWYQERKKSETLKKLVSPGNRNMKPSKKEVEETIELPIFVVDDITTEELGRITSVNDERMSIVSAEGGIFGIMAGRYNERQSNFDIYLKGYSGDPWSTHRIGRKSQSMNSPSLTICLAVQRDVIKEIGSNKQFRGRGLLARFLYCNCKAKVGYRKRQNETIPETLIQGYKNHIFELMDIPLTLQELRLTPDAQATWDEFYDHVEGDMKPGKQMAILTDWGSKLSGTVARIAGLLHFAEHGQQARNKPISVNIVNASVAIGTYYREHALTVFGLMQEDSQIEAAKKILEYLILHKPDRFKGRDVLRHKNAFKAMSDVTPGLQILVERNYIREAEIKLRTGFGRPESTTYETNPKII